jgi:predicted site-specific integrase-resolvase
MKKNLPSKQTNNISSTAAIIERWLDKQDLLQMLHISSRTLQKWRSLGLLPFYKITGKIWYKESEVMLMLSNCRCFKT